MQQEPGVVVHITASWSART